MITFFRRFRQRLLSESKFSKYFLYAIGEIILVVIGILIALSINNWNEKRQQKITKHGYLERLIEDLNNDSRFYTRRDSAYQKQLIGVGMLVETFFAKQDQKSFEYIIYNLDESLTEMVISKKTYDEMVSTGILFSIDDKEVLTEIQEYYNWSEINQYYIKTNNDDLATHWQKPFYSQITIARHYAKNEQSFNHLNLSSYYDQLQRNNIDLRAYLLKYQHIFEIKLALFQEQLKYCNKLIETLNKTLEK